MSEFQTPKCPKCGADCGEFYMHEQPTVAGTWLLLYCNKCGRILGTAFTEET